MCSLANGWIVGHGHAYDGDLRNRRPPVGNRSPSRRARRGSRRDRRVTPSQASAADPQPIAQKSPETDALGSAAFRCRCLPGVSQTPPKDCDWNQTVNAAALSSGADPAEISTAVHAPSPSETRTERAESARGISPRAAHRSVLEPLDSHGSCHPLKAAAFHQDHRVPPVAR